jgi:hypothetical protein
MDEQDILPVRPLDINMKNLPKNPTGVHNKEARNAILSHNNWLEK